MPLDPESLPIRFSFDAARCRSIPLDNTSASGFRFSDFAQGYVGQVSFQFPLDPESLPIRFSFDRARCRSMDECANS
jgi:hypothetical protein